MNTMGIVGVDAAGTTSFEPPIILVIGPEKSGKSSLTISLFDWPNRGDQPLVLAWDPSGPDSCAQLGYPVARIKVKDLAGATYVEKMHAMLDNLEYVYRGGKRPFTTLVTDCASTMVERLFTEDRKLNPSKDPRRNYGNLLELGREYMARIIDLGVPTVWYSWLREPFIEERDDAGRKIKRQILGGPQIAGGFKSLLAGRAHQMCVLEKLKVPPNTPGVHGDGFMRVLHTKPWANIDAGGRYGLPEPMPAHLGYMLDALMRRGAWTPQVQPAPQAQVAR